VFAASDSGSLAILAFHPHLSSTGLGINPLMGQVAGKLRENLITDPQIKFFQEECHA
jgi:hypothetical protein